MHHQSMTVAAMKKVAPSIKVFLGSYLSCNLAFMALIFWTAMTRSTTLTKLGRQLTAKTYLGQFLTVIETAALTRQTHKVKPC